MTPPTTSTPPCAECGPFTLTINGEAFHSGYTRETIERTKQRLPHTTFPCQRCGKIFVLRDGKLEREENKTMIESNIWPKPPQTESEGKTCATIAPYSQAIHSTVDAMSVPVASPAPVQSKPEFGAMPVRYNVTRYGEIRNEPDGQWVRFEDYASERAAREAAEKETQNISERLHEILERTGNTRNERDAAFAERDQLRSQLAEMTASRDKCGEAINHHIGMEARVRRERDAALARVEESEKERDEANLNFDRAHDEALKSREQLSALRTDSVPRKLVEELQKFARHTEACINDPGFNCSCGLIRVRAALAAIMEVNQTEDDSEAERRRQFEQGYNGV